MKNLFFLTPLLFMVGFGCASAPASELTPEPSLTPSGEPVANIVIDSPSGGEIVTSPITVTGSARVYENVVDWRIRNPEGDVLDKGFFQVETPDVGTFGDFEERIFLPNMRSDDFVLEFFNYSAEDDTELNNVQIELTRETGSLTSVEVYFIDPSVQGEGCEELDVEKRTVSQTTNVAELALIELLKGPKSEWAVTLIPKGTELNSISISNGLAKVDFKSGPPALWSGEPCYINGIRDQIEKTLEQFPTVNRVQISVNGDAHNILIP